MDHPFAIVASELKTLRLTLNFLTYQATFSKDVNQRQQAGLDAINVHDQIEAALKGAWDTAAQVADFSRLPQVYGGVFTTLDQFIQLVERPPQAKVQDSPQYGATPSANVCQQPCR